MSPKINLGAFGFKNINQPDGPAGLRIETPKALWFIHRSISKIRNPSGHDYNIVHEANHKNIMVGNFTP
jgi:hypothetical protein